MRAMILGAGLGTRLRPLTDLVAKPAVPFFDRPLVAHGLRHLVAAGVTDVVVNAHHLPESIEAALRPFAPEGVAVEVVPERVLLGTGGGARHALERQSARLGAPDDDEPIVLINGDVLFFPDLAAAIATHQKTGALATLVVRRDARAEQMGAIHVEGERVVRILGPREPGAEPLQFTGVHVLSGRAVAKLPHDGCIVRKGYVPWLAEGAALAAHLEAAPFRDCGTIGEYLAAHRDVLEGRLDLGLALDARGFCDPSARCEGQIIASVVGAGAHVARGARLERCVVWPGEVVTESAVDAVLAGGEAVRS